MPSCDGSWQSTRTPIFSKSVKISKFEDNLLNYSYSTLHTLLVGMPIRWLVELGIPLAFQYRTAMFSRTASSFRRWISENWVLQWAMGSTFSRKGTSNEMRVFGCPFLLRSIQVRTILESMLEFFSHCWMESD
mgnify:FL=1